MGDFKAIGGNLKTQVTGEVGTLQKDIATETGALVEKSVKIADGLKAELLNDTKAVGALAKLEAESIKLIVQQNLQIAAKIPAIGEAATRIVDKDTAKATGTIRGAS